MSLADLRDRLDRGETTSTSLLSDALARINDPSGEGARTFTEVFAEQARVAADVSDRLREAGLCRSPLDGLVVSVKDLFDVAGSTTRAGSKILRDAPPATQDAEIVRRLRLAGAVIVGKTNMTEFAFSGIGLNPHYDTPRNPWDRALGRVPGGSSSGAAVSVTDGMAHVGIGTDTGGSVRIPAALCGIVGFKPTARRVPTRGAYPLSTTLDSIGPLANTVADCALVDAILAGADASTPDPIPLAGVRLLAPTNYVLDGCDEHVTRVYEQALMRLRAAGATIVEAPFAPFAQLPALQGNGGFPTAEVYRLQREMLAQHAAEYDPNVYARMMRGQALSAVDYLDLLADRAAFIAACANATRGYDGLIWPTVPIVAPTIAELQDTGAFGQANARILRNTSAVNVMDGCALSIPAQAPGEPPVGLMLVGQACDDSLTLRIGLALEPVLRSH